MAKRKLGDTNGDPSKVLALEMDIISALSHAGVGEVVENVFSYLDDVSLLEAEKVCRKWSQIIDEGDEFLWRNVLQEKLERDPLWRQLSARKTWMKEVLNVFPALPCSFEKYRDIYFAAFKDLRRLNQNWESGNCERFSIPVTQVEKLMLNGSKIVGVVTTPEKIKVWDRENYRCIWSADVPSGIVSAQLNENILIASTRSGMGTMLKIWDPNTGVVLYNFVLPVDDPQHGESPLKLALNQNLLVTYGGRFSDASDVAVRNVLSPINIRLRGVLGYSTTGGREVEVDQNFLICANTWSNQHASSIDIWSVSTLEILRRIEQPSNVIKDLKVMKYQFPYLVVANDFHSKLCTWNVLTGDLVSSRGCNFVHDLGLCPHSCRIVYSTGKRNSIIKVRDLETTVLQVTVQNYDRLQKLRIDDFSIVGISRPDFMNDGNEEIVILDFLM